MDALVDGLLEELNCDVVFKIPIFGGIPIYESVVVTWIIMAAVFLLCFFLGRNLSVENPGRRQVAVRQESNSLMISSVRHSEKKERITYHIWQQ